MGKRLFVIAGEASGDLHGANLIRSLVQSDTTLCIEGWGGDRMEQEGMVLHKHIEELAFMGFVEVVANLRTILRNMKLCKEQIKDFKPDVLVLIDYPGFNLRIAEWAKSQGIRVAYYISPQVWAWKQSRVHTIKRVVDDMFVILPFEKPFYQQFGMDVNYVGHPLLDEIKRFESQVDTKFKEENSLSSKPILAILPGSRKQEIKKKLPIMLKGVEGFKDKYQCVVAAAPNLPIEYYQPFLDKDTLVIQGKTYDLLNVSNLAVVTSGTATLETALFQVPEVVCYKSSSISYAIAKRLVKIKYISLVNLILDREVVRELIQHECNPKLIAMELHKIEEGSPQRAIMLDDFKKLRELLGEGGASEEVARALLSRISEK